MPKQQVIIFGASQGGVKAMPRVAHWGEVIAFTDNDANKHGKQFQDRPIL